MNILNLRNLAIFTCLIFLQLSITDANPILSSKTATVGSTGYRQSGRKLVNFQRFIRSDANLTEDNQQFDVGATREPFVPTTEDLTPEDDVYTEASPIQSPSNFVISTASDPSEELPSLPLDAEIQDTTENITPTSDIQDVSIMPVVDITESIAKELEDFSVNPQDGSQPSSTEFLINPEVPIEEIVIQPSNPAVPRQFDLLTSATTASPDLPFTAAPADASTEESTNKTKYSSFSSNEEQQENISYVVITHLPGKSTDSRESNSDEKEYPLVPGTAITKPLTDIEENPPTTEAPQSTPTEPSDLPDWPIFYPGLRIPTAPQLIPAKVDPVLLNPSWPMKMNDIFSNDQQLQSGLENKMRTQFHPRTVLPPFKPSRPLYPDVPTSFYTFQPNQPKFRQAGSSIDPPRAPYPHPQGNSSPFYYRPFESALPKPRRLVFPPISNTRENFRFHVNWADELMGRSNWA